MPHNYLSAHIHNSSSLLAEQVFGQMSVRICRYHVNASHTHTKLERKKIAQQRVNEAEGGDKNEPKRKPEDGGGLGNKQEPQPCLKSTTRKEANNIDNTHH